MAVSTKTNGKSSTIKKENVQIDSNSQRSPLMLFFIAPLLFGMVIGAYLTQYLLEEEYRKCILWISFISLSVLLTYTFIYFHRTNCITTSIRSSGCNRSMSK